MAHEHEVIQNAKWKTVLGERTFMDDDEAYVKYSGALSR